MRGLCDLPQEILRLIARKLDVFDYQRFNAVCASFRSATTDARSLMIRSTFPWLMLSDHNEETDYHSFFLLFEKKALRLKLPEIRGKSYCGSSHGWLVMGNGETINLLNFFSRTQIEIPPLRKPSSTSDPYRLFRAIISGDPTTNSEDYMAVMIYGDRKEVAAFSSKEGRWIKLYVEGQPYRGYSDMIFVGDKIYFVVNNGELLVSSSDLGGLSLKHFDVFSLPPDPNINYCNSKKYLVELSGNLLQVQRFVDYDGDSGKTVGFKVYKLLKFGEVDWRKRKWEEMKSLGGDHVLFLGGNHSMALPVNQFPGCKPNRIYFTDDSDSVWSFCPSVGCHDIGMFNLEDESFGLMMDPGVYHSTSYPPIWISLSPDPRTVPVQDWAFDSSIRNL